MLSRAFNTLLHKSFLKQSLHEVGGGVMPLHLLKGQHEKAH